MEIKLAESIRTFRKERSLTQEQLAEVLGVTVGAVYKWEAGLSTPELPLIVEMADFFDTSIDVLLGYILKDNRIDATARRLRHCQRVKDLNGLEEAEKALRRNGFERYDKDPEARGFIFPPKPPYYRDKHPNGNIYSSGSCPPRGAHRC